MTLNNPNQNINYYYSNFVEEMPNKEQIISIVKSTRFLLEFILNTIEKDCINNNNNIEKDIQMLDSSELTRKFGFNNNNKTNCFYQEKALLISNKILRIYQNLSHNFYGQSIILHSEFELNGIVSPILLKSNPSLSLSFMQNYILNKLSNLESISNNKFASNLLEITHNYIMIILLNFYDCLYFEYASNYLEGANANLSNTLLSRNIFTAEFLSDLSQIKCVITDNHLVSLLSSISGIEVNRDNIFEVSKNIQEMFILLNNYLENISSKYYQKNNELYNQFNYAEENFTNLNNEMNGNNENANYENNLTDTENQEMRSKMLISDELADGNQNQENSDNVNLDINNLESEKYLNTQKDEVTNLIDTEMNTLNQNFSTNNLNTPNNDNININNAANGFQSIFSRQKTMHMIQSVLEKLNLIKRNNSLIIRLLSVSQGKDSFAFLDLISSETLSKPIKLPNTRKIYEKCESINKYYEFIQTQNLDFNLAIPAQSAQNKAQSQILNPLLNASNTIGNTSPTNATTAPSNIFSSSANALLNAGLRNAQNADNPYNSLMNKLSELGFARQPILEFDKLLNWKKYRIYLSKIDNLLVRKDLFDLDTCLKILPEEKLLKQLNDVDFSLLVNTSFINKRFTYVNLDSFQQFCNILSNENLIVEKYSNIAYSVNRNYLDRKLLLGDTVEFEAEELYDLWLKTSAASKMTCYKYEFEFYKIASGKNFNVNLAKFGSGIKSVGVLSLVKNNNSKSKFFFLPNSFFIID